MAITPQNKINPTFSLSSMTDIIFLLLVFFMVSSSFIQTQGIAVNKPESSTATEEKIVVTISIDQYHRYFYEQEVSSLKDIEERLVRDKKNNRELSISVNADKNASINQLVKLMDIARKHKIKLVLATE